MVQKWFKCQTVNKFCVRYNSFSIVQLPIAGVNCTRLLSSSLKIDKHFRRPIELGRQERQLCDNVRSANFSKSPMSAGRLSIRLDEASSCSNSLQRNMLSGSSSMELSSTYSSSSKRNAPISAG